MTRDSIHLDIDDLPTIFGTTSSRTFFAPSALGPPFDARGPRDNQRDTTIRSRSLCVRFVLAPFVVGPTFTNRFPQHNASRNPTTSISPSFRTSRTWPTVWKSTTTALTSAAIWFSGGSGLPAVLVCKGRRTGMLPQKLACVEFTNMLYPVSLTRGQNGKMGNIFSFSLSTTPVLLWVRTLEWVYDFQKYPRGCFSPDRRLKTALQPSKRAINSKKHLPDWGTPPSTVQIPQTV